MFEGRASIEEVAESLSAQIREIALRVDELSGRIGALETRARWGAAHPPDENDEELVPAFLRTPGVTMPAFLSGLSIVCFLLVIALILRTLVDNGLVHRRAGSMVGIGYAVVLLSVGYYQYATARKRASLYVVCGSSLLFLILLETSTRFSVISPTSAYALLALALATITGLGLHYDARAPIAVGLLGGSVVAVLIHFPDGEFAFACAVLWLASAAAYSISGHPRYRWISWAQFAIVVFFWATWTVKLRYALVHDIPPAPNLSPNMYFPWLVLFGVLHVGVVLWPLVRESHPFGIFETSLPTLNVIGAFAVMRALAGPWEFRETRIGWACAVVVCFHVVLAEAAERRGDTGRKVTSALIIAALVLLGASLMPWIENPLVALLVWSGAGLSIGIIAAFRKNQSIRTFSYLFQIFVVLMALTYGHLLITTDAPVGEVATVLALAVISLVHLLVRPHSADDSEKRLQLVTGTDRFGISLLVTTTLYLLLASRLGLYALLVYAGAGSTHAFEGGQSIIVNGFALLLMGLGLLLASRELLVLAVILTVAGGAKALTYDLWFIRGLPLVLSVLSFALAVSAGSFVWRRWEHLIEPQRDTGAP